MKIVIFILFCFHMTLWSSENDYKFFGTGQLRLSNQGFTISNDKVDITHMETGVAGKFQTKLGRYACFKFQLKSVGERKLGRFRLLVKAQGKTILKKIIYCDDKLRSYQIPFVLAKNTKELELRFNVSKFIQSLSFNEVKIDQSRKSEFRLVNPLSPEMWAYEGMQKDAPWRREAQKRIELHRKADLNLSIKTGAKVDFKELELRYEMVRHKFPFGTAVRLDTLAEKSSDGERYKQELLRLFNSAVPARFYKWRLWEKWPRSKVVEQVSWLKSQGLELRGHNLIWAGWKHLPKNLIELKEDKSLLDKKVKDHIREAIGETRGLIYEWDVINEPFDNHDLMDLLSKKKMVEWFRLCKQLNPELELYINDYDMLGYPGTKHSKAYYETLQYLIDQKTPFDGIGLQSHFKEEVRTPEQIYEELNKLAAFGKKIRITEHDFISDAPDFQANFMRDFLTICFSHPAVHGINQWGFWEGVHWRSRAALFNKDWTERKNLQAYKQLVFKDWWSRGKGRFSSSGEFKTRVFKGDYKITIHASGKLLKTLNTSVTEATQSILIEL